MGVDLDLRKKWVFLALALALAPSIMKFDHEKLNVYRKSIEFNAWASELMASSTIKGSAKDQLERASMSISLNIAEGNGKSSLKDRQRFLEISKGSSLECAAILDILEVRKLINSAQNDNGKAILLEIVSMLTGLIKHCLANADK